MTTGFDRFNNGWIDYTMLEFVQIALDKNIPPIQAAERCSADPGGWLGSDSASIVNDL